MVVHVNYIGCSDTEVQERATYIYKVTNTFLFINLIHIYVSTWHNVRIYCILDCISSLHAFFIPFSKESNVRQDSN